MGNDPVSPQAFHPSAKSSWHSRRCGQQWHTEARKHLIAVMRRRDLHVGDF